MARISRRKFTLLVSTVSTAGITGAALIERMYAEMQDFGGISRDSLKSFVELSGMKVQDDQIIALQASLERALESMKRIRDRSLPHDLEPAATFRARR